MTTPVHVLLLVLLQTHRPDIPPERAETLSLAVQAAVEEFPTHPALVGALLTAMEQEGNFQEDIQVGEVRGLAGEICLAQIHPVNGFWKGYVASFEDLAGLDLEATSNCLRTAAKTLSFGRNHCLKKRYRKNWAQAMWTSYHWGGKCWLSPHAYKRTARMWHWQGLYEAKVKEMRA
jgi:hypothetical protein